MKKGNAMAYPRGTDPGGSFLNGFGSGMGGCFGVVAAVVVMFIMLVFGLRACSSSGSSNATVAAQPVTAVVPLVSVPSSSAVPEPAATTAAAIPVSTQIAYIGSDGQTYYTNATVEPDGSYQGPADTEGTGATESECDRGWYPELDGVGPGYGTPGHWNSTLAVCLAND